MQNEMVPTQLLDEQRVVQHVALMEDTRLTQYIAIRRFFQCPLFILNIFKTAVGPTVITVGEEQRAVSAKGLPELNLV